MERTQIADFFSKACMIVKQKSDKYSRKKKHYNLIQFMNINKKKLYIKR